MNKIICPPTATKLDHKAAARVSLASLTRELNEARTVAKDRKNPGAMIAATMAKAKLHGLDVSQSTVEYKLAIDFSGAAGELFAALAGRAAIAAPAVPAPAIAAPAISGEKEERAPARIAPGRAR
jgi:hypothetical protein